MCIRDRANPQYQKGFMKFEVDNERKRKKLRAMYDKYEASGAQLTPEPVSYTHLEPHHLDRLKMLNASVRDGQ